MCGIFVVYSKKGSPLNEKICKNASMENYNRGPDYFKYNFFLNKTLFISNTILSITGNVSKNNSIIKSKNNKYFISYNGEIYNYFDLTKKILSPTLNIQNFSDTEVLVNLYEKLNHKSIPKLLNGMFAYVVYDKQKNKLVIVNDVQGEKNLYFYEDSDYFILSSTIKAILKFNQIYQLDETVINNYFLTRHFMPISKTCFKNINFFANGTINEYNLSTKKMSSTFYDDPSSWISEKKYEEFSKMKESEVIDYLHSALSEQAQLMIPKIKFGCIVSGGIDSTLQAAIISRFKDSHKNLVIDHGNKKDLIMNHISKFNIYFKKKISKININNKQYSRLANKCYEIISSPLYTHDLPGRLEVSRFFKKNQCKVFFSADGCDELLGGQQIYSKIYSKKFDFKINQSPYSTIVNEQNLNDDTTDYQKYLNEKWKNSLKKYEFINSKRDRNIQSSLFLDYFVQSINVGNRANDLISCSSSVEPRNVFISKSILKIIINLPLKYKINFYERNIHLKQKYILKKIFLKYFNKELVLPKQGFSGFPESIVINKKFLLTKSVINFSKKKYYKNKNYCDPKNLKRDLYWKFVNTEKFLKFFFNY